MGMTLAGFVALGALIVGLFAWLRQDIRVLHADLGELRERVARIEGLLEAAFMRRDLTPVPETPPTGNPPGTSTAT